MARQRKKDSVLTTSGYDYDKDLARVSIKVMPALQALINNQHDLVTILMKQFPEMKIFLETHLAELSLVEETIAQAYAKYRLKREKQKSDKGKTDLITNIPSQGYDEHVKENDTSLDEMAAKISPGLPSAKFDSNKKIPIKNEEKDIRRIAIGASIKALTNLLGRELTDDEILVIEKQVDSYL